MIILKLNHVKGETIVSFFAGYEVVTLNLPSNLFATLNYETA